MDKSSSTATAAAAAMASTKADIAGTLSEAAGGGSSSLSPAKEETEEEEEGGKEPCRAAAATDAVVENTHVHHHHLEDSKSPTEGQGDDVVNNVEDHHHENEDDENEDDDETETILQSQLDQKCYLYQNRTTGMTSPSPLSVRQYVKILATTGGSSGPIQRDTMVIGYDPQTCTYDTQGGWISCKKIPVLREACSSWYYSVRRRDDDGGETETKGPVSIRALASLWHSNEDNSSGTNGQQEGKKKDTVNGHTMVWSAEVAESLKSSSSGENNGAKDNKGKDETTNASEQPRSGWRSIASDIHLRIALEAFRDTTVRTGLGEARVGAGGQQSSRSGKQASGTATTTDFDESTMTYNDDEEGNDDATGGASEQVQDELQAFLKSTGVDATTATGGVLEKDEEEEEEEEGFESDGGTMYVKNKNTGEYVRSSRKRTKKKKEEESVIMNGNIPPSGNGSSSSTKRLNGQPEEQQQKQQLLADGTKKKKKRKNKKAKFSAKNMARWIYIDGLPSDTDEDEVAKVFSKVGIIELDPETQHPRIKLYRYKRGEKDKEGHAVAVSGRLKGDASLCYAREESVNLAVQILDESYFRPTAEKKGTKLKVSKAKFEQKGDSYQQGDSSSSGAAAGLGEGGGTRKRPRVSEAKRKVARLAAQQALDWDEGEHGRISGGIKGLRIIVLKHVFTRDELSAARRARGGGEVGEDELLGEIEEELRTECTRDFGPVEKMTFFPKNPAGIVVVKFYQPPAASAAVKALHGRRRKRRRLVTEHGGSPADGPSGRSTGGEQQQHQQDEDEDETVKLEATFWDGVTDYSVRDDEAEEKEADERHEAFNEWLDKEQEELPEEFRLQVEGE